MVFAWRNRDVCPVALLAMFFYLFPRSFLFVSLLSLPCCCPSLFSCAFLFLLCVSLVRFKRNCDVCPLALLAMILHILFFFFSVRPWCVAWFSHVFRMVFAWLHMVERFKMVIFSLKTLYLRKNDFRMVSHGFLRRDFFVRMVFAW